jgi:hypothetical protein
MTCGLTVRFLLFALFVQAFALQAECGELSARRVRITSCIQSFLTNHLTADFSGKSISVHLPDTKDPISVQLVEKLGDGLGAAVYTVKSSYFDQKEANGGVVAKLAHSPKWRSEPRPFPVLNSFSDDEYRQFLDLKESLPELRRDPGFPKDFGWEKDPGRLPVAEILKKGQLDDGTTVLFKTEIHGSSAQEIGEKYGDNPPPKMIEGLRKIYDFSQALYRTVKTDGHPFMLDIYPSNLIWVESPEDLKIMGLSRPSFVMPEAFSLKKPVFEQGYSFDQFVSDYKNYIKLSVEN